jgi:regulator of sigma E protease
MDFLTIVQASVGIGTLYVLAFLVALTVIVFIHELGHFLVARWFGVSVEAFSVGFGQEIAGWPDRHGTRWKICWIPLGGYVKFKGDANAASLPDASAVADAKSEPGNFHGKPVWQRAAVVAAGPVANFLLAIAIFAAAFVIVGEPSAEPVVHDIRSGSAAERAGIQKGDVIVSIDGEKIDSFSDLQKAVVTRGGEELTLVIDRRGSAITLNLIPDIKEEPDGFGGTIRIGLLGVVGDTEKGIRYEKLGPVAAIEAGVEQTWFIVETTFRYLGKLITGQESAKQLGGFISIGKAAGDAASEGFFNFVHTIAFLSVSIGLINLFPIPMLDGGHLVYYAIELVRGKPLGPQAQEWGFRIGFSVVILLMVVGTWNDLVRSVTVAFGS